MAISRLINTTTETNMYTPKANLNRTGPLRLISLDLQLAVGCLAEDAKNRYSKASTGFIVVEDALFLFVIHPPAAIRLGLEGLVQCNKVHRETEHEDGQHGEKSREILHQVTNDDSPGPEQMMKREEIEDLHTGEQKAQGEQLIPEVK